MAKARVACKGGMLQMRLMLDDMNHFRQYYTKEELDRYARRLTAIVDLVEHDLDDDVDLRDLAVPPPQQQQQQQSLAGAHDPSTWPLLETAMEGMRRRYRKMLQLYDEPIIADCLRKLSARLCKRDDRLRAVRARMRADASTVMARTPTAATLAKIVSGSQQQQQGSSSSSSSKNDHT